MFKQRLAAICLLISLLFSTHTAHAQDEEADSVIARMERYAREGRLPEYEDLRLPAGENLQVLERYLDSLPVMDEDRFTTGLVFADVPDDTEYARMTLRNLIDVALANNFDLVNTRRNVDIALSETTGEEAFFKPFLDLVGSGDYTRTYDESDPSRSESFDAEAGLEARQNLPTGGNITADLTEAYDRTESSGANSRSKSTSYDARAGVRLTQPLLRGSGLLTGEGTALGTADLRRARLSELDELLSAEIEERDTILTVIRQYFNILTFKRQLLVSRDAILERYRFLDETRVKYDVGRVAESEILRAEIQFLQEIETAISRQQSLDNARESLLVTLGLPLDTPISLVDITPLLLDRGRVEIPPVGEAVQYGLNRRRELMRSDIGIALSEISYRVARNDVLPDLEVEGGYAIYDEDDDLAPANEFGSDTFDAGVSLRIPLQNIQRREAHRRAVLRLENARTSRLSLERDLERDTLQAHRAVLTDEARLTVLSKRVEQARRNLELINDSFEVGFSTITEVRIAQDDLFGAETAYSNAILSYQVNIAELYVSMGLPLL